MTNEIEQPEAEGPSKEETIAAIKRDIAQITEHIKQSSVITALIVEHSAMDPDTVRMAQDVADKAVEMMNNNTANVGQLFTAVCLAHTGSMKALVNIFNRQLAILEERTPEEMLHQNAIENFDSIPDAWRGGVH